MMNYGFPPFLPCALPSADQTEGLNIPIGQHKTCEMILSIFYYSMI